MAIVEDVDLSVTKTFNSATVTAGGTTQTFTIDVTNNGDSTRTTSTSPTRSTATSSSPTSAATSTARRSSGQSLDCTLGHLAAGATQSITVTYQVDSATDSRADVSNTARPSRTSRRPRPRADDTVDIVENVDLAVTKTFNSDTVTAGGSSQTFTISVKNNGVSDADNADVTDSVDADLVVSGTTGDLDCGPASQSLDCTLDHLAAGATASITVTYSVDTTTDSRAGVSNSATAVSDEDTTGDTGTDTVDIVEDVALTETKEFDSSTVTAGGDSKTFTITVSNGGVSDADTVNVLDTVPADLVVDSVDSTDFDCTASALQQVDCTRAHLGAGDDATITVTYHVDATTDAGPVTNDADASSDEDTADTASDSVDIVEDVQLSVDKAFQGSPAIAGGADKTFTIAVTNDGVSDADNVVVDDTVDTRLIVQSVAGGDFTCDAPSQDVHCVLDHLGAGATKTITVTYKVDTDTDSATSVSNRADASSDEDSAYDLASVAIAENVDLAVTKTFDPTTVVAGGDPGDFTISVKNNGVSSAENVHLTDTVDTRLAIDSIDPGSFDCGDTSGQSIDCLLASLPAGETASITVHYSVDTTIEADATVPNTAHASSDEDAAGDDGIANVAIDEDVNLQVTKTFADGAVDAGTGGHTFTIDIKNTGASEADNVQLTDTIDPRLIVTAVDEGDFTCTDGDSDVQTLTCSLDHLGTGDTATVTVTYRVAASEAEATVDNTADATADDGGTGTDSDSVNITTHANVADLKVQSGSNVAGETVTYTSTVTNNGPSDAKAVTFTDTLDTHLTGELYCVTSLVTCTPATAWTGSVLLGTIPSGESRTIVISATIDPSTPEGYPLENTSSAASGTTIDPDTGDNSDTVSTTVDTLADLTVAKDAPATAIAGQGFDYTLTVTNHGPSDNTGGYTVTDTLPTGLTFESAGSTTGCAATNQDVTCSTTDGLAAGDSSAFTVHVSVDAGLDSGTLLENSAHVASDGTTDPDTGNNDSNTTTTTVQEDVTLVVTKTFADDSVLAGTSGHQFTIEVENTGTSDAENVNVSDTVDPRLVVTSTSGGFTCGAASQTLGCDLSELGAGETKTITVTYRVHSDTAPAASVDNTASATSDEVTTGGRLEHRQRRDRDRGGPLDREDRPGNRDRGRPGRLRLLDQGHEQRPVRQHRRLRRHRHARHRAHVRGGRLRSGLLRCRSARHLHQLERACSRRRSDVRRCTSRSTPRSTAP